MELEKKIKEIRTGLKKLKEERELNVKDALESLSEFKAGYDDLIKENGESYCVANCSDIIIDINNLTQDFKKYKI